MRPNNKLFTDAFFNFGVVIGTSLEDMKGLRVHSVDSDMPEVGVNGNLPIDHIKFLAVPSDKVEFVKKMVGQNDIEVISMDIGDAYFRSTFTKKLELLEQSKENIEQSKQPYTTYSKEDVKPVVESRRFSKIKKIFQTLKAKIFTHTKTANDKNIIERG